MLLAALLLLVGCVHDDSVGAIHELDEVTIGCIQDTYDEVYVGHPLRISPQLSNLSGSLDHYDYVWLTYTRDTYRHADTLACTRDLDIEVALTPGEHTVKFRATDRTTQVFYEREFTIRVVNDFTDGLLVLCRRDTTALLHFWVPGRDEVITDIYGRLGDGGVLGYHPHRVRFTSYQSSEASEVIVMCQDSLGGRILSSTTMAPVRPYADLFFQTDRTTLRPQNYFISSMREYLVDDGRIYDRAVNSNPPDQQVRPAMTAAAGSYRIAEEADFGDDLKPVSRMVVYDNQNHCFYCLYSITSAYLTTVRKTSGMTYQKGGAFDPDNVGMTCVYAGLYSRSDTEAREYAGIFRDEFGLTYLLRMGIGFWVEGASPSRYFRDISNTMLLSENVMQAKAFACGASFPAYMFYAYGSSIYAISMATTQAQKIYDLDSAWGGQFAIDHIEVERGGHRLWVAYRDLQRTEAAAGFAGLYIQTDGGLQLRTDIRHDGLGDEVIDFESKY